MPHKVTSGLIHNDDKDVDDVDMFRKLTVYDEGDGGCGSKDAVRGYDSQHVNTLRGIEHRT